MDFEPMLVRCGRLYTQTVLLTRSKIRLMARAENLFFIMLNALLGKDTSLNLNSMINLLLKSDGS